jgi:hypothetical protein
MFMLLRYLFTSKYRNKYKNNMTFTNNKEHSVMHLESKVMKFSESVEIQYYKCPECETVSQITSHRFLSWIFFNLALHPQFWSWPSSTKHSVSLWFTRSYSVGLLGQWSARLKASTCTQTQKIAHTHTNTKHPYLVWDLNPRSRHPSEQRQCMPQTFGYRDRL